jgi:antitoxin (DNA-binding transcriptional repressor) of toxin-antitoxin stability system
MATISLRELHHRTGALVRQAATHGALVVTDRGVPVAELRPYRAPSAKGRWARRRLLPEYARIMNRPVPGDITESISADRDAR